MANCLPVPSPSDNPHLRLDPSNSNPVCPSHLSFLDSHNPHQFSQSLLQLPDPKPKNSPEPPLPQPGPLHQPPKFNSVSAPFPSSSSKLDALPHSQLLPTVSHPSFKVDHWVKLQLVPGQLLSHSRSGQGSNLLSCSSRLAHNSSPRSSSDNPNSWVSLPRSNSSAHSNLPPSLAAHNSWASLPNSSNSSSSSSSHPGFLLSAGQPQLSPHHSPSLTLLL